MEIEKLLKGCFVAVDKPRGPPSAQVGSWVREILGVRKSGHIGTLDPNVSGVLIIALGKAVKLSRFLSKEDKEYIGIMHLHKKVDEKKVRETVNKFGGEIIQKPPLRSAVAKRARKRFVREISIIEIRGNDVLMRIRCEAGTYIRKLMHDIGKSIGCGANMIELRRIESGSVDESQTHTLYELKDAVWMWREKGDDGEIKNMLIEPDMLLNMKSIIVKDSSLPSIAYGSPIYKTGVAKFCGAEAGEFIKVYSESNRFCGTAEVVGGAEMYAKIDVNWLDAKEFRKRWKD